jgi:outer membrane lipoprotein SlyB
MKHYQSALVLVLFGLADMALADPNSDYLASKKQIEADYKAALQSCKALPKSEKKTCDTQAKSEMNIALTDAKKQLNEAKRCGECGSVLEVKQRDIQGEGSGMGIAAGAVAGGLLGKQVGKGKGNTAATIAGALVGGYAGNEAEKALRSQKAYDYVVKLNNGQVHTIQGKEGEIQPAFKIGDRVRFADGVLTAQ